MEDFINQLRVRFASAEKENKADLGDSRDEKIAMQKSQSFKEKKKTQNWFQRQFPRKMSHDYDSREMEHAAAIAAAAFAITSQDVSEIPQQNQASEAPETFSLTKTKSKVDGTKSPISQLGSVSKRLSGSFKSTDGEGIKVQTSLVTDEKKPEKTHTAAPSVKKTSTFREPMKSTDDKKPEIPAPKRTPTFGDKNLKSSDGTKTGTPAPKSPPPVQPLSLRPPPPPIPPTKTTTKPGPPRPPTPHTSTRRPTQARSNTMETKADAWEKAELEKIKRRYEKLKETIASWEDKKKMKARRKLDKHEGEPDQRMKALEKFRSGMQYIDQIAGGARAQADEERRNEELKVKEKANVIRTTGHLPRACPCF